MKKILFSTSALMLVLLNSSYIIRTQDLTQTNADGRTPIAIATFAPSPKAAVEEVIPGLETAHAQTQPSGIDLSSFTTAPSATETTTPSITAGTTAPDLTGFAQAAMPVPAAPTETTPAIIPATAQAATETSQLTTPSTTMPTIETSGAYATLGAPTATTTSAALESAFQTSPALSPPIVLLTPEEPGLETGAGTYGTTEGTYGITAGAYGETITPAKKKKKKKKKPTVTCRCTCPAEDVNISKENITKDISEAQQSLLKDITEQLKEKSEEDKELVIEEAPVTQKAKEEVMADIKNEQQPEEDQEELEEDVEGHLGQSFDASVETL